MTAPIKQNSFAGGEVSPFLYGRTDQIKYETGLRTLRNMLAMRQGGVTNRPGTMYVDTTLNDGNQVRLIPFIFNETGNGQSYVLEFGNQYISFIQNGARLESSIPDPIPIYSGSVSYAIYDVATDGIGNNYISITENNLANALSNTSFWKPLYDWNNVTVYTTEYVRGMLGVNPTGFYFVCVTANFDKDPLTTAGASYWMQVASNYSSYQISSPYLQADLSTLQFSESADVMTITHKNYPPSELKRFGQTNWTLTPITFGAPVINIIFPVTEINPNPEGTAQAGNAFAYYITAVFPDGQESLASKGLVLNIASPSSSTPVNFYFIQSTLSPVTVSYYKIYRSSSKGEPGGFIASVVDIPTLLNLFVDNGIIPDFSNTPPIDPMLFTSSGNYPATVGFIQQRRGFGDTTNNPVGFWLSQPGYFSNFDIHTIPLDSDAIIASVAGSEVNSIQHLLELKFMLLLTAGAEIYVQGNGTGVVTPSAINAAAQSQYGCNQLRPLRIADTFIFNQALGNVIRDLRFDFVINGYNGNELTVFSSHLFEGFQIVDWDYQKIPDSIVWAVRDDGVLLGLTYLREQQMLAWHRHDFQNGVVENVCCIPENGNYATYLCINRVINHVTVRYIERMSSRIWSDVLNATYLDCFSSYSGTNMGSITMKLTAPGGVFDETSSAYQQQLILDASDNFFTSQMVGDQIFISDTDFVRNKGNTVDPENDSSSFALSVDGNQVRCTIISYVSSKEVRVTPNKIVSQTLQAIPVTTWARAVNKVTGLGYLIGQAVSVWADRTVVSSPNNRNISFQTTVASDGSIMLDKHYAVIYVGLPMTSDIETLDLETSFGETMIGRRKRQLKLSMQLLKTRTLFAGSENPDSNFDNTSNDPLFQLSELKMGINRQNYDQPPELITDQDWILEVTRWNRNGRIFIRNVDPTPLTILAVVPGGDSPSQNPGYTRV